jgi:MFS family permease
MSLKQGAILAFGFLLGVAMMGFQMAASRFLTPYFGSGIQVWASLISTTMLALMAGYYIGGTLADRHPRSDVLGAALVAAGGFLALAPFVKDPVLNWASMAFDDVAVGALISSVAIMVAPLTLMSFFSPYAVRLLLADAQHGGRVAGLVYSITTIGNIVGTLGASFVLMPMMGSKMITFTFAGLVALCGAGLMALRVKAAADAR